MKNLELFTKVVDAMNGLDVSLKVGKESELIIKGDFIKMMNAFGLLMQQQTESNDARRQIEELKSKVLE